MLKTQKPNLVSEQDFHKKSDIDTKLITTSKVILSCYLHVHVFITSRTYMYVLWSGKGGSNQWNHV